MQFDDGTGIKPGDSKFKEAEAVVEKKLKAQAGKADGMSAVDTKGIFAVATRTAIYSY